MPIRRDPRTGGWYFRTVVKRADGIKVRIYGTPGTPGPFQDLPNTKIGARAAEDRAKARALIGEDRLAVVPSPEPKKEVPTIREYSATFLDEYAAEHKPSEQRTKERILNGTLLPFFGDVRLDELTIGHVKRYGAAERERGCAVKTINNRLAVLSSLVKYAAQNGVIAMPRIKFQIGGSVKGGKPAAVSMHDVAQLLAACRDARYRVAILLAAEAGLRSGEIRGLQWTDIDDGVITVRRALDAESPMIIPPKHDKVRTVPVSPRLEAALASLPKRGLWVVGRLDGQLLTYPGLAEAIRNLYRSAGVALPEKPIHCLRHTYGTELAAAGVPLPVIQELMGHVDIKTTLRYVDVHEAQKREAVAAAFGWRGSHVAAGRTASRK